MTEPNNDARASQIAELLLYHSVLGRGYISPFPPTKGLVFSSALPSDALSALAEAESKFRNWHDGEIAADRKRLEMMDREPEMAAVTGGGDKLAAKALKEKLSRRPHITWKETQVSKSTLVELMKTHYYGAMTYLDPVGSRLAQALCHASRLAGDLGWITLTEGTTDETLIRANASGGACIHSLAGAETIFNHFCSCQTPHLDKLLERIKSSPGGQVGIGTTIVIPGRPSIFSQTTADELYSLARRVFVLGDEEPERRVKVEFEPSSKGDWVQFLNWTLADILEETPSAWQLKLATTAPSSPRTSVLFAARAAMVSAFMQSAKLQPGPMKLVELRSDHLKAAKAMARLIYRKSSGQEGYEQRIKSLKPGAENFITPHKLAIAKTAIEEAILKSPGRRVSRNQVRRSVPGATLGLLDELVKEGEFCELSGTEQCQMGRTSKAYVLLVDTPVGDELEAVDEFQEAMEDFEQHPDAFAENEALVTIRRIRERAASVFAEHRAPVVRASRLTRKERRMLPKLLDMFSQSLVIRGASTDIQEPQGILDDEDMPIDREGFNLWVRQDVDGTEFCDWDKAGFLKLAEFWGEEEENIEQEIIA